jgi:protocatechuate 3,4-dioxygenase beta subunit
MASSPSTEPTGAEPAKTRTTGTATRRRFLQVGGATALGVALAGCANETATGGGTASTGSTSAAGSASTASTALGDATTGAPSGSAPPSDGEVPVATAALTAADFDGLATCVLLPEMTAGPFPLDEQFDRRDITEGAEGQPMRLGLRVVDDACAPVPGATVEIWHCDATGDYSAFTDGGGGKDDAEGTTFLRGTQPADADGIVEFLSIVPGWYRGRAVHVHLRVHLDDTTVLTSQLFFDADHLADVYADEPYAEFGLPDTSNEEDGIAGDVDTNGTLLVTRSAETANGTGTLALVNLGIDPTATSGGSSGARPSGGSRGSGGVGPRT